MVSVSASHREGPEFCPEPVYKRHCAEKFRLGNHRVPRVQWDSGGARKICGVQSPDDRRCVHRREPDATVMNFFILKIILLEKTVISRILTGISRF